MNIKWDADGYSSDFQFVHKYGEDVLAFAGVRPGMRVLDLGCGNGALSRKIANMGAEVIGVDASAEMLEIAKHDHPDLSFIQADALSFVLDEPVDMVFANAVFHWIDEDKQPVLISNLAKAIKPGGVLAFEMGGKHCARKVHDMLAEVFAEHGLIYSIPNYFPSIGEYTPLIDEHGFLVTSAFLFDRPTAQAGSNGLESWIKMFVKKPFERITEALSEKIIQSVVQRLKPALYDDGTWYVDYVRLRVRAIKQ